MGRDEERKSQKVKKQEHLNSGAGEVISQIAKIRNPAKFCSHPFSSVFCSSFLWLDNFGLIILQKLQK